MLFAVSYGTQTEDTASSHSAVVLNLSVQKKSIHRKLLKLQLSGTPSMPLIQELHVPNFLGVSEGLQTMLRDAMQPHLSKPFTE